MPLWTNRYQGKTYSWASCIAVDSDGNVIVTGSLRSGLDNSTLDYGTVAYSATGVPLWTHRYDGPAHNADEPSGIAVDSSGNVFVTGYSSTSSSAGFATRAYSRAGVPLWTNRYVGPGWCGARGVAVDSTGNVFVTGSSTGIGGVTIKYSSSVQPRLDTQRLSNQVVLSWNTLEEIGGRGSMVVRLS